MPRKAKAKTEWLKTRQANLFSDREHWAWANGSRGINSWQQDFLMGTGAQLRHGEPLSERQREILDQITDIRDRDAVVDWDDGDDVPCLNM
jgi:uncharacterized protein YgfB (UPF0149 family)